MFYTSEYKPNYKNSYYYSSQGINEKQRIIDMANTMSQQFFNKAEEARDEYFKRLSNCAERGYIDASAAESV